MTPPTVAPLKTADADNPQPPEGLSAAPADVTWGFERRKVADLLEWKDNPRRLTKKGLADLVTSIRKFGLPEPVVINTDGVICGGHGRKKAMLELGWAECSVCVPDRTLTADEFRELNIRLNKNIAGEFDMDMLANNYSIEELTDFGFTKQDLGMEFFGGGKGSLADKFMVAPFSVLNARAGWWQSRKRGWVDLGIQSELGRGDVQGSLSSARSVQTGKGEKAEAWVTSSLFDPVLCELAYRWFSPPHWHGA